MPSLLLHLHDGTSLCYRINISTQPLYINICILKSTRASDFTCSRSHQFSRFSDVPYGNTCTKSRVAVCRFQRSFTGVDVLPGFADGSALVQIQNAANLAIIDSVISNIPGNLMIQNSTVQVLRSTFILNSGSVAGAMTIAGSQVALPGMILYKC